MEDNLQTLTDKKNFVRSMFNSIAWRYDFLNHFLSFGTDRLWRRKAIKIISECKNEPVILDLATGTADLAIAAMRIKPKSITGIDISEGMLEIGRRKVLRSGYSSKIELIQADSENIPFLSDSFDVVMVAFGIRNYSDPRKGLSEMNRVLKDSGLVLVLEFSKPQKFPFRNVYNFYFRNILPFLGKLFSGDEEAYNYLPESVMNFPDNEQFLEMMESAGFKKNRQVKLTGGIASIYTGIKQVMQ
ncbi:MAG TPA: bifunctional demethylmenaquinone methyltransferase/2-methoxy-6-polyprenyl-1,4-benzoquinol methylase UbiE [Bacteroidales bacterium]|nr:bifunctional demethylmenaquinone methyltransferase/2-methoxy-6-polyprenyl-1,4-benzoquinol methylase UbiE [Bacteroidales bacterium]